MGLALGARISAGVRRLVLLYVWLTVASSAIVFSEPALYDVLMLGAALLLPVVGIVSFSRGLGLYCMMWAVIVTGGYIATTTAAAKDSAWSWSPPLSAWRSKAW